MIGLLFTYVVHNVIEEENRKILQENFDFRSNEIVGNIKARMQGYEQVLRGTGGLFVSSRLVTRNEFRDYTNQLKLKQDYPGIQGVGFSLLVKPNDRSKNIQKLRKEGFPAYTIRPGGTRDIYTSIIYLEPFDWRNQRAFGFDMYSEPVRRAAMQRARDENQIIASGKVTLVQETEKNMQSGFLLYLPVFLNNKPHGSLAERRENIFGWVYAPFRMHDLMIGILGEHFGEIGNVIDFDIYDGTTQSPESLLYDFSVQNNAPPSNHTPVFHAIKRLDFDGNQWTIVTHSLPDFEAKLNSEIAQFVLVAGLALSLLVSFAVWQLATGRERAYAKAREMTRELSESEARWSFAVEGAGDGLWDWDMRTGTMRLSGHYETMLGFAKGEIEPTISAWEISIHPDDVIYAKSNLQNYLLGKQLNYSIELRLRCKDGNYKWILCRGVVVKRDAEGKPSQMIGIHTDIDQRKQTEARLRLAASVFSYAREGIAITDANGDILDVNDTFTEITNYSREEVIGRNPRILQSGRHGAEFYAEMWKALTEADYWTGEIWNRRKNGEVYAELITISAVRDAHGNIQNYISLFNDITPTKNYQQQLEYIAHYDALTGLANRVLLSDRLERAIHQSHRRKTSLAVVYLDLDGFKSVNDQYGHNIGDELLVTVAKRMEDALREGDTLARIGGDEFVAVLVDLERSQECEPMLERLLQAASAPVIAGTAVLHVSASIGATIYPEDNNDAGLLMRHADQAMYQAKMSGKNRYYLFTALQSEANDSI